MTYDAILLTSFGGPESPEDVMPYLQRVTAGRGVPIERLEEVSHHYLALGGVSPINQQNRDLLEKLRKRFPERGIDIPVYWGNRNSEPFFKDVVQEMYEAGHRNVLAWVTSAYSSYSGCRQYRENLYQALEDNDLVGKMNIDKVRHYFDHPGFLAPISVDLNHEVARFKASGISPAKMKVLFTTHSIPNAMGESSGPVERREEFAKPGGAYEAQHLVASELVMEMLGEPEVSWQLVYQSRSGSPQIPWLEPDVNDAIRDAKEAGFEAVLVVPIGFVSDHVEVVWDLDNEAKETAEEVGIGFKRIRTSGIADEFVDAIAELVLERTAGGEKKALSKLGPWADFCKPGCCPNLRKDLPVVAEG